MKIRFLFLAAGLLFAFSPAFSQTDNSRVTVVEDFCQDFFASGLAWEDCLAEEYGFIPTTDARFSVCGKTTVVDQGKGRYVMRVTADWKGTLVGKNGNAIPFHFKSRSTEVSNLNNGTGKVIVTGGAPLGGGLQILVYAGVTISKDGTTQVAVENLQVVCRG